MNLVNGWYFVLIIKSSQQFSKSKKYLLPFFPLNPTYIKAFIGFKGD